MLNNGRYMFDYDELTGDFSMEIRPVEIRVSRKMFKLTFKKLFLGRHRNLAMSCYRIPERQHSYFNK